MPPKCTSVVIEYAEGLFDLRFINGSAKATCVFEGDAQQVFYWFHDEITMESSDFIGRTEEEIREVFMRRDLEWLQS